MFYRFGSQVDRRESGGSDFLEMQFCRLPVNTGVEKLVAVDSIKHWFDDSLYIDGDEAGEFLKEYGGIFVGGVYNNLKTGPVDQCGINYYWPELTEMIIAKILEVKPKEYEKLFPWLCEARKFNGFYILGL